MKDSKLTSIMFSALQAKPELASYEEWVKAGDFAIEMRFFPHALHCFQRAAELKKNDDVLLKINDLIDKITNVLEFIPDKLKDPVEEIRLSNPLDPSKWLGIANKMLKDFSDILASGNHGDPEAPATLEASQFALSFASYCALRSGSEVEPINNVLQDIAVLSDSPSYEKKLDLKSLAASKSGQALRVVSFGDNVTLGLQPDWEIKFQETYHYLWAREIDYNLSLASNAISGAGVLDLALYLGRDFIYYKPDLALIMLGNVDAWLGKEVRLAFRTLLRACIDILNKHEIQVVLMTPVPHIPEACPQDQKPTDIDLLEVEVEPYIDLCRNIAAVTGAVFVDSTKYFPESISERKEFFVNGYNQPNLEGQKLILKALLEQTIY